MDWPWRDTGDVEKEVTRCLQENYSPRHNENNLKAMIQRGYRQQEDGIYVRFPRREDEMKGIEANWSIDIHATFTSICCPLSIATSIDKVWNLQKRKENLKEISLTVPDFESREFQCNHDIPGYQPGELSHYIDSWIKRIVPTK